MWSMSLSALLYVAHFFEVVQGQNLPYSPSRAFVSPNNTDILYIIQPVSSTTTQAQFISVNISTTLQASSLSITTLNSNLPFKEDGSSGTAYVPAISYTGNIEIYAGSCSSAASVWVWQPSGNNGSWTQKTTTLASSLTSSSAGANFLATAISFSTSVGAADSQCTMYVFGGMCPSSKTSSVSTWQGEAAYSNSMIEVAPASSSYTVSMSAATGSKPIAEAGFTLTGLLPAISNSSSGILTQAQNFVLLGGHTQTAFINMSQIAIFSLPQESWSYQTISATQGRTELAVKSTGSVQTPDSRSGHSAVLTADGSAIIIFGGWVGDINTAATPQLAILRLGSGYGGSGTWAWELPSISGTGPAGQGIYGHAAVMLPGGVMMITGGTSISSSSSKRRRATTATSYFLNTTSNSWASTYTNPSYTAAQAASSSAAAAAVNSNDKAKMVGLGTGLGIGLAAVVAAVLVYLWYNRRLRRRREAARQRDLQALSGGSHEGLYGDGGLPAMEERPRSGHDQDPWWGSAAGHRRTLSDEHGPYPNSPTNLNARSLVPNSQPSYTPLAHTPTTGGRDRQDGNNRTAAITRKPLNSRAARGYYQPAPSTSSNTAYTGFDFGTSAHSRANSLGTAGAIHPIYEADEDADITDVSHSHNPRAVAGVGMAIGDLSHVEHFRNSGPITPLSDRDDPFRDPSPERSGTVLHHSAVNTTSNPNAANMDAQQREREIASWVADWTAADALLHAQSRMQSGRASPSKESSSGRTHSDLSDRSAAAASAVALSRASSTNRTNSLTAFFSGAAGSWNPFAAGPSAAVAHDTVMYSRGDVSPQSERSGRGQGPPSSGSGTSSFTTAQTSQSVGQVVRSGQVQSYTVQTTQTFPALRLEGQSLLPRPYVGDEPGSPSKTRARKLTRNMGWLGSIKRAFGQEEWVSASESSSDRDRASPTNELLGDSPHRRSPSLGGGSGTVYTGDRPQPRRSASATSAMLWRRKQGREDWEDSVGAGTSGQRSNTLTERTAPFDMGRSVGGSDLGDGGDEDEWDIERAVRERVVQVMFTVPKEKLRVVNHDVNDAISDVGSVKGSQKSVGGRSIKSKKSEQLLVRKKSQLGMEMASVPEDQVQPTGTMPSGSLAAERKDEEHQLNTQSSGLFQDSAFGSTVGSEKGKGRETPTPLPDAHGEGGIGERIEGRLVGEVIGRSPSPDKRRSKVLEMVQQMEREKALQ